LSFHIFKCVSVFGVYIFQSLHIYVTIKPPLTFGFTYYVGGRKCDDIYIWQAWKV